jgi:hypothetical protein
MRPINLSHGSVSGHTYSYICRKAGLRSAVVVVVGNQERQVMVRVIPAGIGLPSVYPCASG